jgi:hypothetical protein
MCDRRDEVLAGAAIDPDTDGAALQLQQILRFGGSSVGEDDRQYLPAIGREQEPSFLNRGDYTSH